MDTKRDSRIYFDADGKAYIYIRRNGHAFRVRYPYADRLTFSDNDTDSGNSRGQTEGSTGQRSESRPDSEDIT